MSKEKVSVEAIDNIILGRAKNHQESNVPVENKTPKKGRPRDEEYEARTFRVKKELVQKLRIIAITEGRLQKDILDYALESAISRYEAKHGVIDTSSIANKKSLEEIF